jgi:release factor glutamine methyltransferase
VTIKTAGQWLHHATERIAGVSDTPELDAEVLLRAICILDRTALAAAPETLLKIEQLERLENLLVRRRQGEPIAYLLEEKEFWSLPLWVTRDTLIPRPETELLVECALDRIEHATAVHVLDLGTGSGAIALALARERPAAQITATDVSLKALEVARVNAKALRLQNVNFRAGYWLNAVPKQCYSLIVCNPPYVAFDDPGLETRHTKFEPQLALISGIDGMEALKQIIPAAPHALTPGGWLVLEHGHQQETAVNHLLYQAKFKSIVHYRDTSGKSRVTAAQARNSFAQ